jgi:hypothetical protein
MLVSGLDSNDDWQFGRGFASYKRDSKAVAQSVVCRIREFLNDWFLDVDRGIDWLALLGERNTQRQIDQSLRRTILETNGVQRLDALAFTHDVETRKVTVKATVVTIFDDTLELSTEVA